jgi:hypothetical protein
MIKLALVFVIGLGIGYSVGYREGAAGTPSVMQKLMSRFGVQKVQQRQENRERDTEAVR